jgi:hypothetical protein
LKKYLGCENKKLNRRFKDESNNNKKSVHVRNCRVLHEFDGWVCPYDG